jgi:non-canonical (house-cleaning) NTP pyrophosphatase
MGDDETRRGAFTRAQTAAQQYRGPCADFAVGLEGGIVDLVVPLPPFLPGGGLTTQDMSCFAWMCVLHIPTQRWGFARTASFSLPEVVATFVRGGMELGDADDKVFGRSGSKQEEGAVGILTHGAITRAAYYEHALLLALAPFVHDGAGALHMPAPLSTGSIPRGLYSAAASEGATTA